VNSTLQRRQTFSCKHWYTGRQICATPCDGNDDHCEDYSDEDCKGISVFFGFFLVSSWTIIDSATLIIMEKCTAIFITDLDTSVYKPPAIDIFSLAKYINTGKIKNYIIQFEM
jgi:hypothetical protein